MSKPPAASPDRSPGDMLADAKQLHMAGKLDKANKLYRVVLKLEPVHAEALHYAGILAHQQGRGEDGVVMIEKSLALAPERADWLSNLGNVLQQQKKLDQAAAAYRKSLALDPSHSHALNNLGVLLRLEGKIAEAEECYRKAIRYSPDFADAYNNLGVLLSNAGRIEEAITCLSMTLSLKSGNPEARRKLAIAYCHLGQFDKAIATCHDWLEKYPGDPLALHALASIPGQQVPARASDAYVEKTFDHFARSFETQLAKLEYRAPELVAAALSELGLPRDNSLDVLDAGCGTGLCGPLLAPFAKRLLGVDLSEGMLKHAREKAIYDVLEKAELCAYLRRKADAFDLIASADTLVYFGALEDFCTAAAGALKSGGHLIFTVEESEDDEPSLTYAIKPHGRYNHRAPYVERCLGDAGFEVQITRETQRLELGVPVDGLLVRAKKVQPAAVPPPR